MADLVWLQAKQLRHSQEMQKAGEAVCSAEFHEDHPVAVQAFQPKKNLTIAQSEPFSHQIGCDCIRVLLCKHHVEASARVAHLGGVLFEEE